MRNSLYYKQLPPPPHWFRGVSFYDTAVQRISPEGSIGL